MNFSVRDSYHIDWRSREEIRADNAALAMRLQAQLEREASHAFDIDDDEYVQLYRLVSDYGWGDKGWSHRLLTAAEAVTTFNFYHHTKFTMLKELPRNGMHYVEEDFDGDVEDWDPMDS